MLSMKIKHSKYRFWKMMFDAQYDPFNYKKYASVSKIIVSACLDRK